MLSLAALAFLFNIVLGGNTSQAGRMAALLLALVAASASLRLMATQKGCREVESAWFDIIEAREDWGPHMRHTGNFRARKKEVRDAADIMGLSLSGAIDCLGPAPNARDEASVSMKACVRAFSAPREESWAGADDNA